MRVAPPEHRAYTYTVTAGPASPAVTLDIFKAHINVTHALTDGILQLYLDAAIQFAEKYTGKDLITRTYNSFRDFFPSPPQNEGYYAFGQVPGGAASFPSLTFSNAGFELRRSPLRQVNSISYVDVGDAAQAVDSSTYYHTVENDYSEVLLVDGARWPGDVKNKMQSITIDFDTGIADDESGIEACWKVAIMSHAAMLWANRGDCSDSTCAGMIPAASKAFYDTKRIVRL